MVSYARRFSAGRMKRQKTILAFGTAACVVVALLAGFAFELASTQTKSKADVVAHVHEGAVLSGALISSLFNAVAQQAPQDAKKYGAATVTASSMDANRQSNAFTALVDGQGNVIAHSSGFSSQAREDVRTSAGLALVRAGHVYGLGNVQPLGASGVIGLAVGFPTRFGDRVLVTGFLPGSLSGFIGGELHQIPGVIGAYNYLVDGNDRVIASTNPGLPPGRVLTVAGHPIALRHASGGDVDGQYYYQDGLSSSTWRIVLASPDGRLFASVSGVRKWVPWLIFISLALVAALALILALRGVRSADQVRDVNSRLAVANDKLEFTNAELERRARELARSNAELEQFAAIASHDLQEPLRKVRTFTERVTVMEADRLSDQGRDYLQRVNAAAERMQRLIEDLLKFSRVATHGRAFARVDLAQITRDVLADLETEVERSEAIVQVGELPIIYADASQMRQLMQNLLSNALKFRREGVAPEVSVDSKVLDGIAEIIVRDNGIGFDPRYTQRIFRVFERLNGRSRYPGTGIGLALCRKIAERHGGEVIAESTPDVGSLFRVTIPIGQREEAIYQPDHPRGDAARSEEGIYVQA